MVSGAKMKDQGSAKKPRKSRAQPKSKASIDAQGRQLTLEDYNDIITWLEMPGNWQKIEGTKKNPIVGSKTTTKTQGFRELASWLNVQERNEHLEPLHHLSMKDRWIYFFKKYKRYKRETLSTGWGITDEDIEPDIISKIKKAFPYWERMDALFGNHPVVLEETKEHTNSGIFGPPPPRLMEPENWTASPKATVHIASAVLLQEREPDIVASGDQFLDLDKDLDLDPVDIPPGMTFTGGADGDAVNCGPPIDVPQNSEVEGQTVEGPTPQGQTLEAPTPQGQTPEAPTPQGQTPSANRHRGRSPSTPTDGEDDGQVRVPGGGTGGNGYAGNGRAATNGTSYPSKKQIGETCHSINNSFANNLGEMMNVRKKTNEIMEEKFRREQNLNQEKFEEEKRIQKLPEEGEAEDRQWMQSNAIAEREERRAEHEQKALADHHKFVASILAAGHERDLQELQKFISDATKNM